MRIAAVLHHAGSDGVPAAKLWRAAGFEDHQDPGSQTDRDLRFLRSAGWQIDRVDDPDGSVKYVMTSVDSRLRLQLTDAQQTALRRAVLHTDRADLVQRLGLPAGSGTVTGTAVLAHDIDDAALETVLRAVRQRCLLHFHYKGTDRAVHPVSVLAVNQHWHLHAVEQGAVEGQQAKVFVVDRMGDVHADAPGTARPPQVVEHPSANPLLWTVDDPVLVTVSCCREYAPDVRLWLGEPVAERSAGEDLELDYRVTNRAGLRARLYQLGTRVRLVGPADVRAELLDELAEMAGE